ncbi:HNH endonuclease signature motif containing protein [Anabaena sp. UHCC 0451]|uniref:HNH endonuclease signature motif containing protein n=1 Tax=Anabaena sp. UHCC 0451 TaxID=2055235 RepID=UPI002B207A6C|nr:HNH endonuclease signature motif containing protein [Anabaena sp. UHCC 0451]MEA5578667.1 HNH endonuclease signature motif containing protein [Anabaena sp. UHCC 0451]
MGYPKHWKELAKSIKENSGWRCQKCDRVCLRPGEKPNTTKPRAYNLQVHHWNRNPADNRPENLVALCPKCHLSYHRGGKGNISVGQLSLFDVSRFENC